jgi:hypothetical protein
MGRWLAPRLPAHWVVHDRDPGLLELGRRPPGSAAITVRWTVRHHPAGAGDLGGASVIVASALPTCHRDAGPDAPAHLIRPFPALAMTSSVTPHPGGPLDTRTAPPSTPISGAAPPSVRTPSPPPSRAQHDGRRGPRPASPWRLDAAHATCGRVVRRSLAAACERGPRPPTPAPTGTGAWRGRPPRGSPSPSTTRPAGAADDRRPRRSQHHAAGPRGRGAPAATAAVLGSWLAARGHGPVSHGVPSTAGRWRPRPASPC